MPFSMSTSETIQSRNHFKKKVACLDCRKKKLKCDKQQPTCSRCVSKGLQCIYLKHKKTGPKHNHASTSSAPSQNGNRFEENKYRTHEHPSANFQAIPVSRENPIDTERLLPATLVSNDGDTQMSIQQALMLSSQQTTLLQQSSSQRLAASLGPIRHRELYLLGLDQFDLTLEDVENFHDKWFNGRHTIFTNSKLRYLHYFYQFPKQILHYCYMIWGNICLETAGCEAKAALLYKKSIEIADSYMEETLAISNSNDFSTLYYLHWVSARLHYDIVAGQNTQSFLRLSSALRLAQMFGYDQLDVPKDKSSRESYFIKMLKKSQQSSRIHNRNYSSNSIDEELDPDILLVEEKRRAFWDLYARDKWYSLVTGMPSCINVDNNSYIFTKLPSPIAFIRLGGSFEDNLSESNDSVFLHTALNKLSDNHVLLDLNSSSSSLLVLTVSERIIKWCKVFLNIMVDINSLNTIEGLNQLNIQVQELVKSFETLVGKLLSIDMTNEPSLQTVAINTTSILYHSVITKMTCLFHLKLTQEDSTGSTITSIQRDFFVNTLYHVSSMNMSVIKSILNSTKDISESFSSLPIFILFSTSLKSLFNTLACFKEFGVILDLDSSISLDIHSLIRHVSSIVEARLMNGSGDRNRKRTSRIHKFLIVWIHKLETQPETVSFFDPF